MNWVFSYLHLILLPQDNHYNTFVCTMLILEQYFVLFISVYIKQATLSGIEEVLDKN